MPERTSKRLTTLAHEQVASVLIEGDVAIDATAGNGHDTVFLRRCVGETGQVVAFDVQALALANTEQRLRAVFGRATDNVQLIMSCHSTLVTHCETREGDVGAVMFNLGYLPGADHRVVTTPVSTRSAIAAACRWLRPGGLVSVLVYVGHDGGAEELGTVLALCDQLSPRYTVDHYQSQHAPSTAPQLFRIVRDV
ncbi:MAG: class I SAM-dependent methyltransferase [Pseudomonadota bacterium]